MTKKPFRIGLDILMFVLLVVAVNEHVTSVLVHEIIWVALFVLWCLHIGLNFSFYKNMFKWKYNLARILWTTLDLWLCVAFLVTILSWIPLSKTLFSGLGLHDYASKWLHKIASYWWLILTGIHAGLNCVQLRLKLKNKSKIWFYIVGVVALAIIWLWVYYFIAQNIWSTLFWLWWHGAWGHGPMMWNGEMFWLWEMMWMWEMKGMWGHHWRNWWGSAIWLLQFWLVWVWTLLLTSLILLVPRLMKK